jgi:hypothetical protein
VIALGLIVRAVVAHRRFGKALFHSKSCNDERICRILEEARIILQVRKKLAVVEHRAMGSPALFGVVKPRLLVPPELSSRFCDSELRHIFLHELAHVKRGDLYTNWLLIIVQALHWFNPLVWFACTRIRADREFACDAVALDCASESTAVQFGETMVKVLEIFSGSRRGLETISVVRNAAELKRRIEMIAAYQPMRHSPLLWSALLSVFCLVGLSDAQTEIGHSNPRQPQMPKQSSTNEPYGSYPGDKRTKTEKNATPPSTSASGDALSGNDSPKQIVDNTRHAGAELIRQRLENIKFAEFGVPVETPLSDVIKSLSQAVKDHDTERRGVNFILSSQSSNALTSNDSPMVDDYRIRVNPPLKDVRVLEILEAITSGARVPEGKSPSWLLNYSIQDYAVVFVATSVSEERNELYSRTFKLNPETFLKAVRNRIGLAGSNQPTSMQLLNFFEGVGILFPKSDGVKSDLMGKAIFFNEKTGVLLVRATLRELDVIEEAVSLTQYTAPVFQVKLTMRVAETTAGSKQSGTELVAASAASFSATPLIWKTNVTENSAPIISTVVSDRDWKMLLKALERGRAFDLMTTHEFTIQSGNEAVVSISGAARKENKADVRLIATVLGDDMVLTTTFEWTDTGRLAPQGDTFSVNAVGYITRKIFAATRFSAGETVILSVPRAFPDGKDLLLFITPQNLGASPK